MRLLEVGVAALSLACSLRGTDHLQAGTGGAAAQGGGGAVGGSAGGGACAVDCEGDGLCDDLETSTVHCGCCDEPCAQSCIQGSCVLSEAGEPNQPLLAGVALDARSVYFSDASGTRIWKVPKQGGQTMEAAVTLEGTFAVAIKNEVLHFAIAGTDPSTSNGVLVMAPDTILVTGQSYPQWLDANAAVLAWANTGATASIETRIETPSVQRYSHPTGSAKPTGIALAGTHVYWAQDDGRVMRAPFNLPQAEELAGRQDGPQGIDVGSDGYVYWAERNGVYRISSDGTGSVEPLSDVENVNPWMVAVDDDDVYWSTLGAINGPSPPGELRRVSRRGGEMETLYSSPSGQPVGGVALDSTHVYFVDSFAPKLLRRAKDRPGCRGP